MKESYSASDVARLSGAPLRSVRYWALTQVLQATADSDRAGTGTHRQFTPEEVVIACIVQYFAQKGLQVGQLTALAKQLRDQVLARPAFADALRNAIRDNFKVYMAVRDDGWITLIGEAFATADNLATIFTSLTNESPGFSGLLLNGCFSRLRSEWT